MTVILTRVDVLLMETLADHRVLTSAQAAQAVHLPMSTANYRLNRLRQAGLLTRKRPPARTGTSPLHWWLTNTGRRRVGEPGRVPDAWSSDLFLAHTVATAAVPLALDRHGPSVGLHLRAWQREPREAWSTAQGTQRLTPDGYALVRVDAEDAEVPLLVEVDRATMAPERLREKTRRYLRYTAADAWRERHAMCPVLLVLTTTEDRAAKTLAAAARERQRILGPTGELLVGVCGQVETIDRSITDPVWRADHNDDGDTARDRLRTLTEVLTYRIHTERDGRHLPPWEQTYTPAGGLTADAQ
ncbi:MAG TPA: replication-relaxation family protein [Frankiaceae bacterium]|nr:replication-relaxation family protein [Frankiaceae bacterium]